MRRLLAPALLLTALAGCGQPASLSAEGAWVRLPAVAGRPAAGYVTLHGGPADTALVAAGSPAAGRTELHESYPGGMRPVPSLAVPAGKDVRLAPGGYHIMLFDLDPTLAVGGTTTLRLRFADGRALEAQAKVVGPADPAP